jgi:hypothetical protein
LNIVTKEGAISMSISPTMHHARSHPSRLCSHGKPSGPEPRGWIKGIDHAVWQVADVDRCVEVLVERMGFPLLRSLVCTEDLRFADVNFGGLATRLVDSRDPERDLAFEGRLVALAFESASPLPEAVAELRQRGFSSGAIHRAAASSDNAVSSAFSGFRFSLIRGVAQPEETSLTAAVILIDRLECSPGGEGDSELFAQSPACHFGVDGVRFVTAEVESEGGLDRWRRFLLQKHHAPAGEWRFGSGPSLRVILGSEDRFSSLTMDCLDLSLVAQQLKSCGISTYCCRGARLVLPSDTGGLALRFVSSERRISNDDL